MEGESAASTASASESSSGTSESSGSSIVPKESAGYKIGANDLKELGITLTGQEKTRVSAEKLSIQDRVTKKTKAPKASLPEPEQETELEFEEEQSDDEDDTFFNKAAEEEVDEVEGEVEETSDDDEEMYEFERHGVKQRMPLKEALEFVSRGYDYTEKTKALKEERNSFDAERQSFAQERAQWMSENQKAMQSSQQWEYFIEHLQSNNPELWQQVEQEAGQFKRHSSNPMMERLMSEFSELKSELKKERESKSIEQYRSSFTKEMDELRQLHKAKYSKYGIKLDENKVAEQWKETGLPLKTIYGQIYGQSLLAIANSKDKLARKERSVRTAPTVGKLGSRGSSHPNLKKIPSGPLGYKAISQMISEELQ